MSEFRHEGSRSHQRRPSGDPRSDFKGGKQTASSRWLAFLAIQAFVQNGEFVSKTLDRLFTQFPTEPRDRAFATELAAETIRRGLTIDAVLAQYVSRPRESVEEELWILLQLGCCQLLFLPHIPVHAAVHETVELCERLNKHRAKGFINGTLRNIEREQARIELIEQNDAVSLPFQLDQLDSKTLPVQHLRGRQAQWSLVKVARAVFANPATAPIEYISQISSLPIWLIDRWHTTGLELDALLKRSLWYTTPGFVSLRVNLQVTTREAVLALLEKAEVPATAGTLPEAIRLGGSINPGDFPEFHDGWFSIQDESAMAASVLLDPQPGEQILDLCAAPGGKTSHLAERLNSTGTVIACDISETRLRPIRENQERLKLINIHTQKVLEDGRYVPDGPFDAAIVDVPCSNTGVLGKRPEARWRITPSTFMELLPLQRRLLLDAVDRVKPGGRIVYSTCSVDPEENSRLVHLVINSRKDLEFVSENLHEPGALGDGGYQALIKKRA